MESASICRICFEEEEDASVLISPCDCKGSQAFAHEECLKKWQMSVMINAGNRPQDVASEERHQVCNVCKARFDIQPVTRRELMESLANFPASKIGPGLLMVHEQERPMLLTRLPYVLQMMVDLKHAHFKRSVYLLTAVEPKAAQDGEDKILGVNLVRPFTFDGDAFDTMVQREGTYSELKSRQEKGMTLEFAHGGPCRPRIFRALALMKNQNIILDENVRNCAEVYRSEDGETQIIWGDILELLSKFSTIDSLCAFSGQAEWSRTQLLGEMARGSWGTMLISETDPKDLPPLLRATADWSALFDKAKWAPMNVMQIHRQNLERHRDHAEEDQIGEEQESQQGEDDEGQQAGTDEEDVMALPGTEEEEVVALPVD